MDGEWRPCLFFTTASFPLPFCLGCPQLGNKYDGYCLVSCGNVFSSSHVHKNEKWGHNFLFLQNYGGGHRQSNIREAGQVKNHWFTWRANQWPLIGGTLFSSFPPSNSLVSVSDPRRAFWADTTPFFKVFFELTWRTSLKGFLSWDGAPYRALNLASCVAFVTSVIRIYQVWRVRHGVEVPGLCQKQLTQSLIDCVLWTLY